MSMYKLSKLSGVPQSTISDICSKKTSIEKCSALTLHKIAKVLSVTVDYLLEEEMKESEERIPFETFKSAICHKVKLDGDIEFIVETIKTDEITQLYKKEWYREAFYLLAMVDYLSRINNIPKYTNYNEIRTQKLKEIIYPESLRIEARVTNNPSLLKEAKKNSIPEFMHFNIVENEVRDVV